MTPEEAREYNRCFNLEQIALEMDVYLAEELLEKSINKGYFTEKDVEIVQGFITAAHRLIDHAKENRRSDYDDN